jgi:hypothetical protein
MVFKLRKFADRSATCKPRSTPNSERMFKKRISEWKIHKNYKAADKVLVLNHLLNQSASKDLPAKFKNRTFKVQRLIRFCKQKGIKVEEHILGAFKAQQSVVRDREQQCQIARHDDYNEHRNPAWPSKAPAPLMTRGEMQNAEIILLQIGHYFESYFFSQVGLAYLSQINQQDPTPDAESWEKLLLFHRTPPCNSASLWNLMDHGQHLLFLGETQLSFAIFDRACTMVRHLLQEHDPLLIPHVVSIFANRLAYWSNTELRDRFHEFVVEMATVILGVSHPITVIISLLKNPHQSDLFALSWQRVLDLFGNRLGTSHRATIEVTEAFSSALYRPNYPRPLRSERKFPVGRREFWSKEEVHLALKCHSQELQDFKSMILDEKREEHAWILPELSESLRLLQAILASDEKLMNPQIQWLRHDSKLRILLVCNQMYYHLDFEAEDDRHGAEKSVSREDTPEVAIARRRRTQTVFSALYRTWNELGWEEEAARLKAAHPMAFEEAVTSDEYVLSDVFSETKSL